MPYLQLSDGRNVPVEGANFVIGADAVCDLTLQDEGVAARHAILQFDDDNVWRLATLSLQSKTRLNNEPVESIVALEEGDELTLGSATLRWLEKEPVSAKRFPVWVPIVLLIFICLTTLGLWAMLRQFNAPDVSPTAVVADQTAEEAVRTGDVDVTEGKATESVTETDAAGEAETAEKEAEATPVHIDVPAPSESVQVDGSEEATAEEETPVESVAEPEAESAAKPAETEGVCPVPDGWVQMTVKTGQRVKGIAKAAGTTARKIKDANCLSTYTIEEGDTLWVPQWPEAAEVAGTESETTESSAVTEAIEGAVDTAKAAAAAVVAELTGTEEANAEAEDACPPPDGWVQMTVETGQRVKGIAKAAGTTARKIKDANCLSTYTISAGDMLWVPPTAPAEAEDATSEAAESTESAAAPAEITEAEDTCHIPDGWVQATVEKDMKLKDIAEIIGSKARVIKEGNCLPNYKVTPGQMIWVPPLRTPPEKDAKTTVTADTNCPYPENWVQMTVQKGQKLRDIAHKIGVQPREIKGANCLPDTKVQTGMILWVPRWDGKG